MRALALVSRPDGADLRVLEDKDEITFGRSLEATVPLDDSSVSRLHTLVRCDGEFLIAKDLGSKNGTKINGQKLYKAERVLKAGDVVYLGKTEVVIAEVSTLDGLGEIHTGEPRSEMLVRALLLARRYAAEAGLPVPRIERDARMLLSLHSWAGRNSDLRSAIEHAVKRAGGGPLHADHFPPSVRAGPPTVNERAPDLSDLKPKKGR